MFHRHPSAPHRSWFGGLVRSFRWIGVGWFSFQSACWIQTNGGVDMYGDRCLMFRVGVVTSALPWVVGGRACHL